MFVVLKPEILEATKKKIKLWIYIVAALSGVVLLVLCVLILKKVSYINSRLIIRDFKHQNVV